LTDDRQLWEQICQGDARAFEVFYQENAARLQEFLRHVVGNRQAAEDLMQETFTQIWRHPNGFEPKRGTLRGYLYGIGRNRAAEWWRKQARQDANDGRSPADCRTETATSVGDAFRQLPEEQRSLLWLREVEGQSYTELAEILDVPVGTVRSRLFAARNALRKIWQSPRTQSKENS
jgi:RNA polymerase sigma-70 factor (ECF subfamily)